MRASRRNAAARAYPPARKLGLAPGTDPARLAGDRVLGNLHPVEERRRQGRYPTIRGELLGKAYLACQLASLCVSIGCLFLWFTGSDRAKVHHAAAGLIIITEFSMLAGPYRFGVFATWDLAQSMLVALYITIVPVQGVSIWRRMP